MEFLSECGEQVRCWVECEKRNSTFTSNHVLSGLLYKHSSPLLRRKVNFLNEGKKLRSIIPTKKSEIALAIGFKIKKIAFNLFKNNQWVQFSIYKNSQLLSFSLPTEEIFSGTPPNLAWGKTSSCRFYTLSHKKCLYWSHWMQNSHFFLFVFRFYSPSKKFCTSLLISIQTFQCFSSHNWRKFRQMTLNWEWWRFCHSFIHVK